jgi:SET domain-containing protein
MIKEIHPPTKIYIKFIDTKKGWGVFCKEKIFKDEIVEYCYGVIDNYNTSSLKDYAFTLNEKNLNTPDVIHALGYGGVYNHSDNPNIKWEIVGNILKFTATQDIESGQEICINYGVGYLDKFKTRFI